jgi:hypothetical protein
VVGEDLKVKADGFLVADPAISKRRAAGTR